MWKTIPGLGIRYRQVFYNNAWHIVYSPCPGSVYKGLVAVAPGLDPTRWAAWRAYRKIG